MDVYAENPIAVGDKSSFKHVRVLTHYLVESSNILQPFGGAVTTPSRKVTSCISSKHTCFASWSYSLCLCFVCTLVMVRHMLSFRKTWKNGERCNLYEDIITG